MESGFEGVDPLEERQKLVLNDRRRPLPIRHGNAKFRRKRCRLQSETHNGSPSNEARANLYHKTDGASAEKCSSRDPYDSAYPVINYPDSTRRIILRRKKERIGKRNALFALALRDLAPRLQTRLAWGVQAPPARSAIGSPSTPRRPAKSARRKAWRGFARSGQAA